MDHTSTYEAYMIFRMTEAEHVAKNYPTNKVSEYEAHLLDAYDRSLVVNSMSGDYNA